MFAVMIGGLALGQSAPSMATFTKARVAATLDNAAGLMFAPSYIDVVIKSPLLNVEFPQALVNVRGVVVCKEECDPSVSVTIVRKVAKHNEARKIISAGRRAS